MISDKGCPYRWNIRWYRVWLSTTENQRERAPDKWSEQVPRKRCVCRLRIISSCGRVRLIEAKHNKRDLLAILFLDLSFSSAVPSLAHPYIASARVRHAQRENRRRRGATKISNEQIEDEEILCFSFFAFVFFSSRSRILSDQRSRPHCQLTFLFLFIFSSSLVYTVDK